MTANRAMFSISTMSRTLGVSRAGYYAWLDREPSARDDAELTDRIAAIHKASRETYGAPRIHAELIDDGIRVGRKRVERLMKVAGIAGVSRRKGTRTTFRGERVRPAPAIGFFNSLLEIRERRQGCHGFGSDRAQYDRGHKCERSDDGDKLQTLNCDHC
jgi:transposase InsO family protein